MNRNPEEASDVTTPGPQSIRELRARLGLTQEEFAHAIAVTVSTVNRWENGHANPSKLAWRAIQTLARKRGASLGSRTPTD
jgi:DNA-binding transcriptional regulator YiaG